MEKETLTLTPLKQKEAKAFVNTHHRHHKAPVGDVYRIGLKAGDKLIGVIMVGRPVSRHLDDGLTLEVNRLCVLDGYKNACSKLYSAAARAGKALGYKKIITYILEIESGVSLKASGWRIDGQTKGSQWSRPSRKREQKSLFQQHNKTRYAKTL